MDDGDSENAAIRDRARRGFVHGAEGRRHAELDRARAWGAELAEQIGVVAVPKAA